ncbi:MAG: hypothetical protein K8F30_12740, partial [Taibaiella sp.]|nr:hypothetical protein [Taibaiella sp.]
ADPYEACGTLTNTSAISGNIALIKRGNCEFGAKALAAQNAGAVAVVIVNNIPGPPVGMGAGAQGAGVTIPVIMVSDVEGAAIETALGSGAVTMSMSVWSNGYTTDIGFVDRGLSLWHSYSIPLNQLKNAGSMPYKGFNGAVIGNFGTTTVNNITLKATLRWTPTGGSTSVVRTDSINIASFTTLDSILTPFMDMNYNLAPTTTGRYDVDYELTSSSSTDQFLGDNNAGYSFYVTDQVYSKGRYDFANNRPYSSISYRLGSGAEFTWGPLMYMEKANYVFESVQISLSKPNAQTDNSMAGQGTANVFVWEWVDGNGDSIMTGDECDIVGLGAKPFVAGDTSSQVHTVEIKDAGDGVSAVPSKANTWYWVTVGVPTNLYLAVDGVSNYFVRAWGRSKATARTREPYAPMYGGVYSNFLGANTPAQHFPFEAYYWLEDSIRFSQQRNGLVPSVPVQMSLFPVSVAETGKNASLDIKLYPNPATEVLNVSLNLDKQARQINYTTMNALGVVLQQETHTNV